LISLKAFRAELTTAHRVVSYRVIGIGMTPRSVARGARTERLRASP